MSDLTTIEWCDHTWNPWEGCTKVSPGCTHCYAEARNHRFGNDNWGKSKQRRRIVDWKKPLRWNAEPNMCNLCGVAFSTDVASTHRHGSIIPSFRRPRMFPSLCDWLDQEVPIEWLADFLKLIHDTPNLDWLLLTKRPENFWDCVGDALAFIEKVIGDWPDRDPETNLGHMLNDWHAQSPPTNVWVGVSVEDQRRADERIPELLKIPAKVRFLSVEPLLGPVDIKFGYDAEEEVYVPYPLVNDEPTNQLHWVIVGGESGPRARPCNVEWIRGILQQCEAAAVPCFVKQLGSRPLSNRGPQLIKLKHPKGGDPSEWPEDLRVRQFPYANRPEPMRPKAT